MTLELDKIKSIIKKVEIMDDYINSLKKELYRLEIKAFIESQDTDEDEIYCFKFERENTMAYGEGASIQECLDEAKQIGIGDMVYIGKLEKFKPVVDSELVIRDIREQAECDDSNASIEYLLDTEPKAEEQLEMMLTETYNEWAKLNNIEVLFGTVKHYEEYNLSDYRLEYNSEDEIIY